MPLDILQSLQGHEMLRLETGGELIKQDETSELLYFLIEGEVEVLKDNTPVSLGAQPGSVFGEMAVLLGVPHTATVKATRPSSFYVVEDPREFLAASPAICLHVCELMARRLDSLNKYLVDVKHQFEGHDHIGMVDQVLETLLHRQPRPRVRPSDSTIRRGGSGELAD